MPDLLHRAAEHHGDKDLVVTGSARLTFAAAEMTSRRLARQLVAAGAGKGTRVGLLLPQGCEWVVTFLAAARTGALVMPFSTFLTPPELGTALRHGDVQLLVVPPVLFGWDMEAFVEAAVPGLALTQDRLVHTKALPFLRSVLLYGGGSRPWVTTLDPDGSDPATPGIDDALITAIEHEVTPADLLVTIHTSGTTGTPKGVVHTHGAQVRHGVNLAEWRGMYEHDRIFASMPFFWVGGLTCTLLSALYAGATLLCQERFEEGPALDLIEQEGATKISGWPNVRHRLMSDPSFPGRALQGVSCFPAAGTAGVDPQLRHNSLGMSETSGPHTAARFDDATAVLPQQWRGSFGPAIPFVEHRIACPVTNATLADGEEGEICVRGYNLMVGLYKEEREDVFDPDGWYHTGDRGYLADGYLFFTGRATEMIKTAGSNVAPREVETAIESLPDVTMALVFGCPDEERGQIVAAAVVPAPGAALDSADLQARLRAMLSSYKVPRAIIQLTDDDIVRLGTGKPDRHAMAARVREQVVAGDWP